MERNRCFPRVDGEILGVGHPNNQHDAGCQPSRQACGHEGVDP
jgi:hypothetical protein